jgi:hypothetical protein
MTTRCRDSGRHLTVPYNVKIRSRMMEFNSLAYGKFRGPTAILRDHPFDRVRTFAEPAPKMPD